jgi:nucleotide-binding universal stress UspA family protein
MKLDRIFVPTDLSEASNEALERAVGLSCRFDAALRIFHAGPLTDDERTRVRAAVAALVERWPAPGRPIELDLELVEGPSASAHPAIMQQLRDEAPDLVVMATHGGGLLGGSVAELVVRDAPCHVLTCHRDARGRWPWQPGTVLVPVDFSEPSRRALGIARELVEDGKLVLVHVVDTPDHPPLYGDAIRRPFQIDPALPRRIEAHMRDWAEDPVDHVVALEGPVRSTLLGEIGRQAAALVVIGTRGEHSLAEHLLGSTATRITRAARAPVLTVR